MDKKAGFDSIQTLIIIIIVVLIMLFLFSEFNPGFLNSKDKQIALPPSPIECVINLKDNTTQDSGWQVIINDADSCNILNHTCTPNCRRTYNESLKCNPIAQCYNEKNKYYWVGNWSQRLTERLNISNN